MRIWGCEHEKLASSRATHQRASRSIGKRQCHSQLLHDKQLSPQYVSARCTHPRRNVKLQCGTAGVLLSGEKINHDLFAC